MFEDQINSYHAVKGSGVTRFMKKEKYSELQWKSLLDKEEEAIKQGDKFMLFTKASMTFIVDDKTRKFKCVLVQSHVSSFRVFKRESIIEDDV